MVLRVRVRNSSLLTKIFSFSPFTEGLIMPQTSMYIVHTLHVIKLPFMSKEILIKMSTLKTNAFLLPNSKHNCTKYF
jgi:hypothetical protein